MGSSLSTLVSGAGEGAMPMQGLYRGLIGLSVAASAFEIYLEYRAYKRSQRSEMGEEAKALVSREEFLKANAYSKDSHQLAMVKHAYSLVTHLGSLKLMVLPRLWGWTFRAARLLLWSGIQEGGKAHSLAFVVVLSALSLLELPWALYGTFVVEGRHGFNNCTLREYLMDVVKSQTLGLFTSLPLTALALWIIESCGEYFYVYLQAAMLAIGFVMSFVQPTIIQPLFNKYTPLPEGVLRGKIEALAQRAGFPLGSITVVDGSRRSASSNAYLYGFWKAKRIVLYDTLLEQMQDDDEQVVAVLGHELGHWRCSHNWKQSVCSAASTALMLYCFKVVNSSHALPLMFGFDSPDTARRPVMIGLMLFSIYVWAPIGRIVSLGTNILSRRFEHQADAFSVKMGYGKPLRAGLLRITARNKGSVDPDPLYCLYHHSHPSLAHRLRYIAECEQKFSKKTM